MDQTGDLLEDLASALRRPYLSDLYSQASAAELLPVLRAIAPDAYPLSQWNDAVSYILQGKFTFLSAQEAKSHLLRALPAIMEGRTAKGRRHD